MRVAKSWAHINFHMGDIVLRPCTRREGPRHVRLLRERHYLAPLRAPDESSTAQRLHQHPFMARSNVKEALVRRARPASTPLSTRLSIKKPKSMRFNFNGPVAAKHPCPSTWDDMDEHYEKMQVYSLLKI